MSQRDQNKPQQGYRTRSTAPMDPEEPPSPRSSVPAGSLRRSTSPPPSFSRRPVPQYAPQPPSTPPPVPEFNTLNFHRRPSTTYDPTAASRQLISPMSTTATAATGDSTPPPNFQPHRRKSSHSRQPSISLASPTTAHYPMPPPSAPLPPEPVPTRTRAPLESFASVEMLQGQREIQERRRGSEIFRDGRYEGRGLGEAPASSRRGAPNENVRQTRSSNRMAGGAPPLPPMDLDLASIANQLREHDLRRGSADDYRRFSVVAGTNEQSPTSTEPTFIPTPNFAFPSRADRVPAPPYTLDEPKANDDDLSPYHQDSARSGFANPYPDEKSGWKTEFTGKGGVGGDAGSFLHPRPSIVALPVYPSPSGSLARSLKWRIKKGASYLTWFTVALAEIAVVIYMYRRVHDLLAVEHKRPGLFVSAWIFLGVEMFIALIVGINAIWKVVTYRPASNEPKLRLRGDKNLPSIDVFVVSSGQDDQVTFDCAIAAASMDYPAHRFRVMVLDSSNSAALQRDINRHAKSQGCPHLSYHRRILDANSGDIHNTKANSINFGMKEAASFGMKGPAEFIAVLDAEMIPERNFLRAALPALLADAKCGIVKTGQGFINLPLRLSPATALLMNAAEPKSHVRSGFVLRRSALTEIGGFPENSWIQDGQCEALLMGRGYSVVVVDEVLQWGMAKPTYSSQVNQMMINRVGPLRTAWRLGFFIGRNDLKLMPFTERLKAIGRALSPLLGLLVLLITASYPALLSYGGLLVLTSNLKTLNSLLEITLFMLGCVTLHELVWTWSTGLSSPRQDLQVWIFMAPYQALALTRMILPAKLGGYKKGSDNLNMATPPIRPSIWKRLGWLLLDPHSTVGVGFLAAVGVAIWRAVRDFEHGTIDYHQTALTVLLTVAWPSLVWVDFVYGSLVPHTCLLFPSRLLTEKREAFLIRDTYSSVARPKHAFKSAQPFKVNRLPEFLAAILILGWSIACVLLGLITNVFA